MNDKLVEKYIKYETELLKQRPSVDFIENSSEYYKELYNAFFLVYDKIKDKERWLKGEINSLITEKNGDFDLIFENDEFNYFYKRSILKYELIDSYLEKKQEQYDISLDLLKVYKYYSDKSEEYKILDIVVGLILYTKRNSHTDELINNILKYYQIDDDFEDSTIILKLHSFIEKNYSPSECLKIKNIYPQIDI